jgi:hypothetical protein
VEIELRLPALSDFLLTSIRRSLGLIARMGMGLILAASGFLAQIEVTSQVNLPPFTKSRMLLNFT